MTTIYTTRIARDPLAREDITNRRLAGESMAAIGAAYGISRERVRQLCKRWNVVCPVDLRQADQTAVAEALALVESGVHIATAAAKVGIDASTVSRHASKRGLDTKAIAKERSAHLYDGRTFGMWTAVPGGYSYTPGDHESRALECVCACGTRRKVKINNLLACTSRGCGCRNSTGQRRRTPWVCSATGERMETTADLARATQTDYMVLMRRRNRGQAFTDTQGRVWEPDAEAAVPHNVGTPWICLQTKETWPSSRAMAAHLGVCNSALSQSITKGRAYPGVDGRHYCPVGREEELEVKPRHPNSGNAMTPQAWVCHQTGQQWTSRSSLERHLGLGDHGLARRSTYTAPDGLTYSRMEAGT